MDIDTTFGDLTVVGMTQEAGILRVARISGTHTRPAHAVPAAYAAGAAAAAVAAGAAPSQRRTNALTVASVIGGNR